DPYLNVDPGTMSPYQHGEVYVLDDGAETDLDLGHYERFTNVKLTRLNNLTSGQVYQTVLNNEREGKYLGKTVQVIPHVTDEIKSKPTQQSVAKLREIGIMPHILVCRCERPLDKEVRQKISLFCNVPFEAVIEEKDVDHSIYEVPLMLQRERMDDLVCNLLRLDAQAANMSHWKEIIRKLIKPQHRVRIAVVGKYIELQDAYKSVYEAISHGGIANDCGVEIQKVDSEDLERDGAEKYLKGLGGILVPGGFGERGIEGKILAARYARENNVPYLGLCLGMQIATIEFARNVLKLPKAH